MDMCSICLELQIDNCDHNTTTKLHRPHLHHVKIPDFTSLCAQEHKKKNKYNEIKSAKSIMPHPTQKYKSTHGYILFMPPSRAAPLNKNVFLNK